MSTTKSRYTFSKSHLSYVFTMLMDNRKIFPKTPRRKDSSEVYIMDLKICSPV